MIVMEHNSAANRIQVMIVMEHSSAANRIQAMIVWSTALLQTEYRLRLYGAQLCCKQNTGYDCYGANRIQAMIVMEQTEYRL